MSKNNMFHCIPPMPLTAFFPWFASKKITIARICLYQTYHHHVKCILTTKLAFTSIRPRYHGFFFKLIDEEVVKSKVYIAAMVIFQCYKRITFACNFFIFFHVNSHCVQRKLTLTIVCWFDFVLLFGFTFYGEVNMNSSFFIFISLCSFPIVMHLDILFPSTSFHGICLLWTTWKK